MSENPLKGTLVVGVTCTEDTGNVITDELEVNAEDFGWASGGPGSEDDGEQSIDHTTYVWCGKSPNDTDIEIKVAVDGFGQLAITVSCDDDSVETEILDDDIELD